MVEFRQRLTCPHQNIIQALQGSALVNNFDEVLLFRPNKIDSVG
jgi:hypothetical protein